MKKAVIYTQRVEVIESYNERRDCVDQKIPIFFEKCGYLPVPIPNVLYSLSEFVQYINPAGIVLTGGNSLVKYGGGAPERDDTDRRLLEIAINEKIPVYGLCRGMQSILDYFGNELIQVKNHVAVRHQVCGIWGERQVNSYHNQACKAIRDPLKIVEMSEDGVIEAVECTNPRLAATMWHPEREEVFSLQDIEKVCELFG